MTQESKVGVLIEILDEVEQMETVGDSKYTHAVQVLAPIELLQQVDQLVEANARLTRPLLVFRRALRMYLKVMRGAGRLEAKPKSRRRTA